MSNTGELLSNDAHNRHQMTSSPGGLHSVNVGSPFHGPFFHLLEDNAHSLRHNVNNNSAMHSNHHQTFYDMFTASSSQPSLGIQHHFSSSPIFSSNRDWSWGLAQEEEDKMLVSSHDWSSSIHAPSQRDDFTLPDTSPPLSRPHIVSPGRLSLSSQKYSPGSTSTPLQPSLTSTNASPSSDSPNSSKFTFESTPLSLNDASLENEEEDDEIDDGENNDEGEYALDTAAASHAKKKIQRRQGVTCDHCRSKHVRCVSSNKSGQIGKGLQCERCQEKNLQCTRNYAPPSRRYPRPSRTGKRIEQARMMHGTLAGEGSLEMTKERKLSPQMLLNARPNLYNGNTLADTQLTHRVMAGCISLRLLTCFFATAHMQMPIVDFHNFSARYNYSQGDCRIMAVMANGGDSTQGIPSAKQSAPGLLSTIWPPNATTKSTQRSTLATAGSSEALIAVMHAWAALYTDMPIAFGSTISMPDVDTSDPVDIAESGQSLNAKAAKTSQKSQNSPELVIGANGKWRRPKRKQGVACDTCRLRRLRCDKLERPKGMGCSRCEDKRIVCTDEYIQSKRRKNETNDDIKGENDEDDAEEGTVGSAPTVARDVLKHSTRGERVNEASLEQQSWIREGNRSRYVFGRGREALAYGKARQPFFQALLQKAIDMVAKNRLKEEPSVEAIQTLTLLAQILDLSKARQGEAYLEAAASHITKLGLESNYEVDEGDRKAVEQILGQMQKRRLWCCVWTRDAIGSGLYRHTPMFDAERALGIRGKGSLSRDQKSGASTPPKQHSQQQSAELSDKQTKKKMGQAGNNPELNGEMGLSFSILALMQVGALSRFMSRHIDNITSSVASGASRQPPTNRIAPLPTGTEMRRLTKACQALWKSIDSLLLFFDQCSLRARKNMDDLQPFHPLGWIATIKIGGAMLDLATFRNLAERLEMAKLTMQLTGDGVDMEQRLQVQYLKELMQQSQKRTLISCRKIVKLVDFLLAKNVFQTGGIMLRQLLPVTQFLAKMPCEAVEQAGDLFAVMRQSGALPGPPEMNQAIDPRALLSDSQTHSHLLPPFAANNEQQEEDEAEEVRNGHVPESIFTSRLEPFDVIRKHKELDVCLEALAQLGYSSPTMDVEIAGIEAMMRAQN